MFNTDILTIKSSDAGLAGAAVTATDTVLIAAGTNLNGLIMLAFSFTLNSTVATACNCVLKNVANTVWFLGGKVEAGSIICTSFWLPKPLFIPAGMGVSFNNAVSPANVQYYGSYRLL